MILGQRAAKLGRISISHPNRVQLPSRRRFTAAAPAMVEVKDISPSSGEDPDVLAKHTTDLVDHGHWQICNGGKGLERVFKFKTFKATWDFMDTVAAECKRQKHHPEWTNIYNRTHVRWTTHNPEGLSGKDVGMARFCDDVAREKGEVPVEPGENQGSLATAEARECCAGKK